MRFNKLNENLNAGLLTIKNSFITRRTNRCVEQNNYKENLTQEKMNKRGQATIFIIIAVVIVVGIIILFFLAPDLGFNLRGEIVPNEFLQEKIQDSVNSEIEILAKQGGYSNPEGAILYRGNNVKYLCYTAQYYLPCRVQQPMIKEHFEEELNSAVEQSVKENVGSLKSEYERRGFSVSGPETVESSVKIVPGEIRIDVKAPMTVTKDVTQNFNEFNIEMESQMYDLLMLATSIIDFESTYGDSETSLYMQYYPNLDIQKIKLGDGSTIYILRDVTTDEEFMFASRGLAWPGGYGFEAP